MHSHNKRDEAITLCRAIWRNAPAEPDTLCQLGTLFHQLGDTATARRCFQRAIALQPDLPAAHAGLGIVLHVTGHSAEALIHLDQALARHPNDADTLTNRGLALHAIGRVEEALHSYDTALKLRPVLAIAWYNRGNLLRHTNRPAEALASFDRALAVQPDFAQAHNNRGVALQLLNRHAEALLAHDRALALMPDDAETLNGRAGALLALNRHREALACYDRALTLDPGLVEAHLNRAYCRLALGDFAAGWEEHEWRWHLPGFREARRAFPQPLWDGQRTIENKTILLWPEQGLGDILQFCRYVPLLAAHAQVVLQAPQQLLRLMCSLPGGGQLIVPGQPPPPFDLHCPMMSLPRAFHTDLDSIPAKIPYLSATPADVALWRRRLAGLHGLRVGLVWAGNPRDFEPTHHAVDQRRSCGLAQFAPLARLRGIDLVSLQKGAAAVQARTPPAGLVIHDWTDQLLDFADTAALIETLDLVISVDTSVVHLAGALGKPVWVLSRFDACWRWLIDREDSPWYPTARLFRQPRPGDWPSVMDRVATELRKLVDATGNTPLPPRRRGRSAKHVG